MEAFLCIHSVVHSQPEKQGQPGVMRNPCLGGCASSLFCFFAGSIGNPNLHELKSCSGKLTCTLGFCCHAK